MVSVHDSGRNALCSCKGSDRSGVTDTGCSYFSAFTVGTLLLVSHVIEVAVWIYILFAAGCKGNVIIIEIFSYVFVDLQQLVIFRCSTFCNLIGNGLEVFYFFACDRCNFFCYRITETDGFQVAQISLFKCRRFLFAVCFFINTCVFLDDFVILQDRELTIGYVFVMIST